MTLRTLLLSAAAPALLAACATAPEAAAPAPMTAMSADAAPTAKNVILMVSDGIGFNGWLASDYHAGKAGQWSYQVTRPDGTEPVLLGMAHDALNLVGPSGELLASGTAPAEAAGAVEQGYDPRTRWDRFETTFSSDYLDGLAYTVVTDSAAAGTALMSGRKTANGRINMDWSGEERFQTIGQIAMERGRAAGAVASVMASHATPASVAAHNVSRNNYAAIFNEMLGSGLSVIMGGGHPLYDASGKALTPEGPAAGEDDPFRYVGGQATFEALSGGAAPNGFAFTDTAEGFAELAAGENLPERVVGIAQTASTLQAARETLPEAGTPSGMAYIANVPDLATMSVGALNVLDQDPDGFFVMIEGGAVDWMGHANNMPRFIEEQTDFSEAVEAVVDWVETNSSWDETLLIITSDHETGGIWGEGTWTNSRGGPVAASREPDAVKTARFDPREDRFNRFLAVQDRGAGVLPGYQFASGNHTNELVPLWAIGPGAGDLAEFERTDLKAAELWGEPYGWDGAFVDNTAVFTVMEQALR